MTFPLPFEAAREAPGRAELLDTRAVVQALPDPARRAVTLRFVYGSSHREIAARLGVSDEDVLQLLAEGVRAVAALKKGALPPR